MTQTAEANNNKTMEKSKGKKIPPGFSNKYIEDKEKNEKGIYRVKETLEKYQSIAMRRLYLKTHAKQKKKV